MPVPSTIGVAQIILSAQSALLTKGFLDAQKQIAQFTNSVMSIGKAWLAFSTIKAGAGFVEDTMQGIVAQKALAGQLGISMEALAGFNLEAAKSGVEQQQLAAASGVLQKTIAGLAVEAPQAMEAFRGIGVTMADLAGKNYAQQFGVIADAIARMPDASQRTAAAMKLFGDQGRMLLPMLMQGSQGLRDNTDAAKSLGIALSDVDAEKVAQATRAMAEASLVVQGLANDMVVELAPVIAEVAKQFTEAAAQAGGWRNMVLPAVEGVAHAMGVAVDIGGALAATFHGLVAIGATLGLGIVTAMDNAVKSVQFVVHAVGGVQEAFGSAAAFLKVAWTSPIGAVKILWADLSQWIEMQLAHMLGDVAHVFQNVNGKLYSTINDMGNQLAISANDAQHAIKELKKQYPELADANDKLRDSFGNIFNFKAPGSDALNELSAGFRAQGEESAEKFRAGWNSAIMGTGTGAADAFFAGVRANANATAAASVDSLKGAMDKIRNIFQYDANQEAEWAKGRAAYLGTADNDPRVVREKHVLDLLNQCDQERSVDQQLAQVKLLQDKEAFWNSHTTMADVAYQDRANYLVAQAHDQFAQVLARKRQQEEVATLTAYSDMAGNLATLAGAFAQQSKAMFIVNKLAAMAQAEVNAWVAYSQTLASTAFMGPGVSMAMAGIALAAGQVAVSQIAMQQAPGRANGGPVSRGHTYLTGERGPELITMGANGYVTPNNAMGGGTTLKQTVTIINNVPGAAVRQETSADGLNMNVIFDQLDTATAGGIRSGTSKTAKAMEAKYGLNGSRGAH